MEVAQICGLSCDVNMFGPACCFTCWELPKCASKPIILSERMPNVVRSSEIPYEKTYLHCESDWRGEMLQYTHHAVGVLITHPWAVALRRCRYQ